LLFLFLFYLSVNGSEISKLLGEKELTEEEKQAETRKLVEMYKAQHTNKSKDELQNMVDNPDGFVESSVIAAKNYLIRKTCPNNVYSK
jgi:hypothetical protein